MKTSLRASDCPIHRNMSTIKAMPRPPDIIVVGAGIVGCAIAYELARRGASVQIVEERTAGMGATQAAAGHSRAAHRSQLAHAISRSRGPQSEPLRRFHRRARRPTAESAVLYRRTGTLQVATTDEGMRELRNAAARLEAQTCCR